jgi:hypothetical protein
VKRRALLLLGLCLPLLASGPAAPIVRRADFREAGDQVVMQMRLPELLSRRDVDAMENLSSGFSTRLVYDVTLYRYAPGGSRPIRHVVREVRISFEYWNRRYVVESSDDEGPVGRLYFKLRDDAVDEVATLRIAVGRVGEMDRGVRNPYFAVVYAQRNPAAEEPVAAPAVGSPGQSGDLRMFSRWVSVFVRSRLSAEVTVLARSTYFYLVES